MERKTENPATIDLLCISMICNFTLMTMRAATKLRSPMENRVLSFVISVFANRVSMQKYPIIDSATAMTVLPTYIQILKPPFLWLFLAYAVQL